MSETIRFIVLVKAAPVLTRALDETMYVAGARLDLAEPGWVRLHPVPFRDLADESRFAKYQVVGVNVRRPRSDRRPESWSPLHGTIAPGESLGTENGWAFRRRIVDRLPDCESFALWRHVRRRGDWRERMRSKFEDEMWERRDSVLFVGNQEEHPTSFLVLGVFWPPAGGTQGVLDL